MSEYDLERILPHIPHLAERQAVAAALKKFEEIGEREHKLLEPVESQIREIEDAINERARAEIKTATAELKAKATALREGFKPEWDKLTDYPDIDGPWSMHDDHLGCYCCEITGLPLRLDDDTLDYGDGYALRAAVEAALRKG